MTDYCELCNTPNGVHTHHCPALPDNATTSEDANNQPATEPAVILDERLLHEINVREWGMPSLCIPGQMWRSEKNNTISCMVSLADPSRVKIETLPLKVAPAGTRSELPHHWRAALWEYTKAWHYSGCKYGPLLAITETDRCNLIRALGGNLVASDNIGCCSIANAIGQAAAKPAKRLGRFTIIVMNGKPFIRHSTKTGYSAKLVLDDKGECEVEIHTEM